MTTVIDHAIAIPTKQVYVWEQVSDLNKNHLWQADCEHIAFLTTMRTGKGTRWRNTAPSGKESIIEITAWYEGLGYEYVIVDGSAYPTGGKGRVRLQEAPEGTIVQWTFTYEAGGMFGGLFNALGTKKALDTDIIDSLKNLYSYIKHVRGEEKFKASDTKALMQDAPDVSARAKYQPRHPSALDAEGKPITSRPSAPPTRADEDRYAFPTQQRPASSPITPPPAEQKYMPPPSYQPPTFQIPEPPVADDDTAKNLSVKSVAEAKPAPFEAPPAPRERVIPLPPIDEPSFLRDMPKTEAKPSAPASTPTWEEKSYTEPSRPSLSSPSPAPSGITEPPLNKLDTGHVSVFDLFGLQKPSETQELRAVASSPSKPAVNPIATNTSTFATLGRRRGLRAKAREKISKVRLP